MAETSEREAKTDNQGRIIDSTGRPLRDKSSRTSSGPFRGKGGKDHPRLSHLKNRIAGYESVRNKQGYKCPGSLNFKK
jgi:hypothetical protein